MGVYRNGSLNCIVTNGERPTNGKFVIGCILDDLLAKKRYQLTTKSPWTWAELWNGNNVIKDVTEEKYGTYMAMSSTVKGEGMMSDVASVGATFTPNNIDGSGSSHAFATGSSTIQNAGIQILRTVGTFAGLTRPTFNPFYKAKIALPARTTGDLRHYEGFITTSTTVPVGEAPIAQADGGLVLGFNSTDANFNVWHGDGTAAITKVEMTFAPVPAVVTSYKFEIKFTSATNAIVTVYNGTNAVIDTKTITTNLPAATKSMNWVALLQNPSTTNKSLTVQAVYMGALK